jgi:hypothetical protein
MSRPSRKRFRSLILIPIFGGVFWVTALIASTIPGLLVLGVNVHGLGTASYAGDPGVAIAPLSQQILNDVGRDTGTVATPTASPAPVAGPSPEPSPTPVPSATPTPSPTPSATAGATPSPLPLPSPLPTVSPLPTILPTPTPAPTPTATATPARATITGQVIDTVTQVGIAAARVTSDAGGSATTDINGNFTFDVNAGSYTLTASATGYNSSSQTVAVNGAQTVRVTFRLVSLTATGGIKGNVTSSVTGAAVVGAMVRLTDGLTTITDINGSYSFPTVLYGNDAITASATGYTSQTQSVTVKPGHTTTLNFGLTP